MRAKEKSKNQKTELIDESASRVQEQVQVFVSYNNKKIAQKRN
jgi:hypothetical protein